MSTENKNIWFTRELFQEKWESRLKIKMPTNIEKAKIIYNFLKLQAGQSTDSTSDNINTIARCAALITNPENFSELWFKDYFEKIESNVEQDDKLINLPDDWIVVPNFNQFIQNKVPHTVNEVMNYFDIFNDALAEAAIDNFKILDNVLYVIPLIAMICLQCLAKKPNSVSYALKKLGVRIGKLIPPLTETLFDALSNLSMEPMKCNSEAINVVMMFLKLYDDSVENKLTENQKIFVNEIVNQLLLIHLKGNGIQLAYIFFRLVRHYTLTSIEMLEVYRTPVVNPKINKSINRLREFIDFYGNSLNDNSLLWWSRILDRSWMIEFSTTLNKKLILRMSPLVCGCRYMQVVRNSKHYIREAAENYASAVSDMICPSIAYKEMYELIETLSDSYIKEKRRTGKSKQLLLAHLNL